MTRRTWVYIWSVLLAGVALAGLFAPSFTITTLDWSLFVVLTVLATAAQLFEAVHGRQSFYPHFVFFFAGVLLLHPFLFVLLVVIPHLIEWAKERLSGSKHLREWYIQPFNIATHIIAGIAGHALIAFPSPPAEAVALLPIFAVVAAVLLYVVINHLLIGLALLLARGITLQVSGVFSIDSLLPDVVMACLGCIVAVLWQLNPWWLVLALAPLALMYTALAVPQLKHEAQTDAKTGLLNARHFNQAFGTEFERARRLNRPLAFIMADLDLLRTINNTYGHLAGDAVLTGIASIIRQNLRADDLAGRFGGEEFAIILPETELRGAKNLAERLRAAIEAAEFTVATSPTPIRATMSMGVACLPDDATTQVDLIHQADVAVYHAKAQGRNRVVSAAEVPHSIKLEHQSKRQIEASAQDGGAREVAAARAVQTVPAPVRERSARAAAAMPTAAPVAEEHIAERPVPSASQSHQADQAARASQHGAQKLFQIYVGGVIACGAGVGLLGMISAPPRDIAVIGVLALLALLAELFQINVYSRNTVSVSVAVAFGMALVGGVHGIVLASAAIVLGHSIKRRPQLHRAAFNWATHVLAGSTLGIVIQTMNMPLQIETLPRLALPIALAAVAYYAVDTGLIAGAISFSTGTRFATVWRDQFKWLAAHYLVLCGMGLFMSLAYLSIGWLGIGICILPLFLMRYAQKQYVDQTEASMHELRRMNTELAQANGEILEANKSIRLLNDELFETLARFLDAQDPYVGGHAAKVGDYATVIAREMGLSGERLDQVRQAALLHDIGKIGIPDHILNKPGKLTAEEYQQVKTHATLGAALLEQSQGLRHLAPFVRHHHERWDGQGYPDGLRETQISLEARILNISDSVEAMASDRPYHKGMSLSEIIAEIRRGAGRQFDPAVAEAFIRILEREGDGFIVNSAREVMRRLSDSQMAQVVIAEGVVVQSANIGLSAVP